MAVGLPVIATTSGGLALVVNLDPARPTGWLVRPDDEQALADTLVDAANHPAEIARRGDAVRAHARTHLSSPGRIGSFAEAYARATDHRGRRPKHPPDPTDNVNHA